MNDEYGRFSVEDQDGAVRLFAEVVAQPGSWCNLSFEELEDEASQESPLFGFLAARGPANPLATVMVEQGKPLTVGIQHRAGTKAAGQLRDAGVHAPEGARVRQDHPRRGLVVEWPDDAQLTEVSRWLFDAMRVLNRARTTQSVLWEWRGR